MAAVQLNFSLNTPPKIKTVQLLGSWDNYRTQLPLTRTAAGKYASWAGKFRFQSSMLKPGQRYWYYYILDGHHVYHDVNKESTVEKTTRRTLNILDVPRDAAPAATTTSSHARVASQTIPKGRALSPSKIQHPKPSKPYESRRFCENGYVATQRAMDALNTRFAHAALSDSDSDISASPTSSTSGRSMFSSRGGSTSPTSSVSSMSSGGGGASPCTCQRFGITAAGQRVRIHCGGKRCGGASPCVSSASSDSSSSCSSSDSEEEEEYRRARAYVRRGEVRVRR
ncbi:hypothetical protein LOZ57_004327 [Ophidiomyces ophidiicola]|uniref:uncharacterized protein n=1 Tax=Ophidiomyces ophidiicola TaxID=1387563 RepID=UPI0020C3FBD2|nr:uncharacterized protein LOZ57_004327 [Ophidiomyces ophidiicola]KAI1945296.1 hypothetical protein LOZ57_004327 [Ophidiomyces ophidiicola]KAI2057421.1 hypothetical protein LOZ43_003124 [Ophidiomyces ophidiicola]